MAARFLLIFASVAYAYLPLIWVNFMQCSLSPSSYCLPWYALEARYWALVHNLGIVLPFAWLKQQRKTVYNRLTVECSLEMACFFCLPDVIDQVIRVSLGIGNVSGLDQRARASFLAARPALVSGEKAKASILTECCSASSETRAGGSRAQTQGVFCSLSIFF